MCFRFVIELAWLSWSWHLVEGPIQSTVVVMVAYALHGAFAYPEHARDRGFTFTPLAQEKGSSTVDDPTVVLSLPGDSVSLSELFLRELDGRLMCSHGTTSIPSSALNSKLI